MTDFRTLDDIGGVTGKRVLVRVDLNVPMENGHVSDATRIERDLRKRLCEWRGLLRRQTPTARQMLARLLDGRIAWTPRKAEGLYEFAGRARFDDALLSGIVVTEGLASPAGFEPAVSTLKGSRAGPLHHGDTASTI